jgi:hypothetical protein
MLTGAFPSLAGENTRFACSTLSAGSVRPEASGTPSSTKRSILSVAVETRPALSV